MVCQVPFGDGLLPWLLGLGWFLLGWFLSFLFPLDFHGRVRVVRSRYLPAALHGVDASLLASDSLRKLRSSIRRVVLLGVTLLVAWSGSGFACSGGVLLSGFLRLVGCIVSWRWLVRGSPGHGPVHLLVASASEIGFSMVPSCAGLVSAWVASAEQFGCSCSALSGCYP